MLLTGIILLVIAAVSIFAAGAASEKDDADIIVTRGLVGAFCLILSIVFLNASGNATAAKSYRMSDDAIFILMSHVPQHEDKNLRSAILRDGEGADYFYSNLVIEEEKTKIGDAVRVGPADAKYNGYSLVKAETIAKSK